METKIATRVIIYKDGKILLSRNAGANHWYPGGGGLEENETLTECATREVLEETGQKVEIIDLMYVQEFYFSENERSLELFYLAHSLPESQDDFCHKDTDDSGKLKIEENRWFSEEEIKREDIEIFPEFVKKNFWEDIRNFDKNYRRFHIGRKGNDQR
jgi:ADP-ribose pyrophosphatase YjhB (NUDIX family)